MSLKIAKLNLLLIKGFTCAGGRLDYSNQCGSVKHPVFPPVSPPNTSALTRWCHTVEGLEGTFQAPAMIHRFWIVHGAPAVKRMIGKCWRCWKYLATMGKQMMAPLSAMWIQQGWFPFQFVGVDYFGPLLAKRGRKVRKRY